MFGIKENENNQINVFYNKEKVNSWCGQIMDYALRNLSNKLNKPFKYCMTTIIQQNNGAGLLTSCKIYIFKYEFFFSLWTSRLGI